MARNHRAGRKLVSVKVRSILGSSYGDVSRDDSLLLGGYYFTKTIVLYGLFP